MFGRLIDVYFTNNEEAIHVVNSDLGNKALKCSATIECYPNNEKTTCVLKIYNLDKNTRSHIKAGDFRHIIIKFGYKDVNGGVTSAIFDGTLQRTITQRPSPETTCTVYYAYELGDAFNYGFYSGDFNKGTSLYDVFMSVAKDGEQEIPLTCSDYFRGLQLSKDMSFYDSQINILQQLTESVNGALMMQHLGRVFITTVEENDKTEVIVFSGENENGKIVSTSGIVNIPTLEDDGLSFECLVNPNIHIYSTVLMSNSLITDSQGGFEPTASAGAVFDENGLYVVTKISTIIDNTAGECKMRIRALARSMYVGGNDASD